MLISERELTRYTEQQIIENIEKKVPDSNKIQSEVVLSYSNYWSGPKKKKTVK